MANFLKVLTVQENARIKYTLVQIVASSEHPWGDCSTVAGIIYSLVEIGLTVWPKPGSEGGGGLVLIREYYLLLGAFPKLR